MIMAALALVMIAFLKVPLYVLVNSQLDAFSDLYEAAASDDLEFKNSTAQINQANEMAQVLRVSEDDYHFSEIISQIDKIAGEEIDISSYNMGREEGVLSSVTINGQAGTRQSLASFKDRLEFDERFVSAALPISNLAKDVDIPFNITIKLAVKETSL